MYALIIIIIIIIRHKGISFFILWLIYLPVYHGYYGFNTVRLP